jgi:hypothetical protein
LDLGGQFAWIFQLEGLLLDENSNMHVFIKKDRNFQANL